MLARRFHPRLTAAEVKKLLAQPGWHSDGAGLKLQVTETGAASWVFRYTGLNGRERYMGLGSAHFVSLSEARQAADEARKLRRQGIDPLDARNAQKLESKLAFVKTMTFKQCAATYFKDNSFGWNPVHARQWIQSLEDHAYPILGNLPVAAVDTALVMKVLNGEPSLWTTHTETADRVRSRIEAVIDWAMASGFRAKGDNPALWPGHLDKLLPSKIRAKAMAREAAGRDEHFGALPYPEIGTFMAELRQREGVAARALEFTILTCLRTKSVLGARWEEFDRAKRMWTVPKERMKGSKGKAREHRVPLSDAALAILDQMEAIGNGGEFVFADPKNSNRPLSGRAMLLLLTRHMGRKETVHGFRSSFSDWAAETTHYPREVCEVVLAHTTGSKVERDYRHGDLFDKRVPLMAAWAKFCGTLPEERGKVIPMTARA